MTYPCRLPGPDEAPPLPRQQRVAQKEILRDLGYVRPNRERPENLIGVWLLWGDILTLPKVARQRAELGAYLKAHVI